MDKFWILDTAHGDDDHVDDDDVADDDDDGNGDYNGGNDNGDDDALTMTIPAPALSSCSDRLAIGTHFSLIAIF